MNNCWRTIARKFRQDLKIDNEASISLLKNFKYCCAYNELKVDVFSILGTEKLCA